MLVQNEYQEIIDKAILEFSSILRNKLRLSKLALEKVSLLKKNVNSDELFDSSQKVMRELDEVDNGFYWQQIVKARTNKKELIELLQNMELEIDGHTKLYASSVLHLSNILKEAIEKNIYNSNFRLSTDQHGNPYPGCDILAQCLEKLADLVPEFEPQIAFADFPKQLFFGWKNLEFCKLAENLPSPQTDEELLLVIEKKGVVSVYFTQESLKKYAHQDLEYSSQISRKLM